MLNPIRASYMIMLTLAATMTHAETTSKSRASYPDERSTAPLRMEAQDFGPVLRHGHGPSDCDKYGARDIWVYEHGGKFYMTYDAAGPIGWLATLAVSDNLTSWVVKGPVLDLGTTGTDDSASASYGTTYFDGSSWHMYYLGTPNVTPPPDRIPGFPYLTLKARSSSPEGPWTKQYDVTPFRTKPGTYYADTASPGMIIRKPDGEYLQFFSASTNAGNKTRRTLSIARTRDLNGAWTLNAEPIVPLSEQIENSSLYFEPSISTWFLFTNHIALETNGAEYTDAIWVYWSRDLEKWNIHDKAVVLDGNNCKWSSMCIGLPSVIKSGNRLAVLYDAPGGNSTDHMQRDVGLAWLNLPLTIPR